MAGSIYPTELFETRGPLVPCARAAPASRIATKSDSTLWRAAIGPSVTRYGMPDRHPSLIVIVRQGPGLAVKAVRTSLRFGSQARQTAQAVFPAGSGRIRAAAARSERLLRRLRCQLV